MKIKKGLLAPETTTLGMIKNIIFGAFVYILWSQLILWVYKISIPEFSGIQLTIESTMVPFLQMIPKSDEFMFVAACIFAPIIEEFIYRSHLSVIKNIKIKGLLTYAIYMSSILFGLAHWGATWSVPIQGVAGLIFCYVYIKNGYSYISSVSTHFLINFYLFIK